jgi:RNA polymerase sigma factor (sigma-70 family)
MKRRLTPAQQRIAEDSLRFVKPAIASFIRRNPDLRQSARRVDMQSIAMAAVATAALTYNAKKSQPTTYFSSAIRHALYREVLSQAKRDGRYVTVEKILDPVPPQSRTRLEMRALKAIAMLSAYDRTLLEDRLIEAVTLEQLGWEQGLDPRTIAKRVRDAIDKLKLAESNLP